MRFVASLVSMQRQISDDLQSDDSEGRHAKLLEAWPLETKIEGVVLTEETKRSCGRAPLDLPEKISRYRRCQETTPGPNWATEGALLRHDTGLPER